MASISSCTVHVQSYTNKRPSFLEPAVQSLHKTSPFKYHELYWWLESGVPLSVLLRHAGYTEESRVRILKLFTEAIAPNLGPASSSSDGSFRKLKSFMVDDHTLIELSWDWNTGVERPMIRFSIEPVGMLAGSQHNPGIQVAPQQLKAAVLKALPRTDFTWLNHFSSAFGRAAGGVEGHPTSIFWAFDLMHKSGDAMSKAYFFPGPSARRNGQTTL